MISVRQLLHTYPWIVIQTRVCIASNTRRAHPRKDHAHALLTYAVGAVVLVPTFRGLLLLCILAVEPGDCLNGFDVAQPSLDDSMYDVARIGYDTFGLSDSLPYSINCLCRRELLLLS